MKKVKALGMLSGGLDSSLAAKILLDQGIEIEGINFSTGFCVTEHTRHFKDPNDKKPSRPHEALRLAAEYAFKMRIVDISADYLPVVTKPKYGYGAHMNPCIDCRIFMFRHMRPLMEAAGAQFIFTGEVLGQRPKSQFREALKIIERDSGLEGLILRPLSAQLLDPTVPEIKGWVKREELYDVSGRSRKPQMAAAKTLGMEDYPQPAGGCCFLADERFSDRLRDFFEHNAKTDLTHEDVILLKVGRHFRISGEVKAIVGRNERENNFLKAFEKGRHAFRLLDYPAAHVLAEIKGEVRPQDLEAVARLAARYSDGKAESSVRVEHSHGGHAQVLEVAAADTGKLL